METKPTTASGPFSSTADGRPDVNVDHAYVIKGTAKAYDVIEAKTIMHPAILIP